MFVIEDQQHAESIAEFDTLEAAMEELKRFAEMPWDTPPNRAPCQSWRTCRRTYEIREFDISETPWKEIGRPGAALEVSAAGVIWSPPDE